MEDRRPALLRIGQLQLSGNGLSRVEAQRLADALPAALERAAAAWPDVAAPARGPSPNRSAGRTPGLADTIARRIVAAAIALSRANGGGAT
jgi:hypothetical protein